MAWKSFYLGSALVKLASLPFFLGCEGKANLPSGGCLIAANHASMADGPLLASAYAFSVFSPLHMIAYDEPFRNWLFGWFLRSGKCIPFKRGEADSQLHMLKQALGWLALGEAVGIFPEGHISRDGRLGRFRSGMTLLAFESGKPIVPAAIINSRRVFPLQSKFPRFARIIKIRFGEPIYPTPGYHGSTAGKRHCLAEEMNIRVRQAIEKLML